MNEDNKISLDVFLLTGEWSDYSGKNILKFIGTNDELGPIEIIITNNKPVFFIERSAILNPLNKSYLRKETKLKNFNNQPVDAIYFSTQKQLISTLEELNQNNVTTYESDVDPLRRFLMEKSINSQMKITGVVEQKTLITKFLNPIIEPCNVTPNLVIASIDI
jgi:DNA polymerase-2